MIEPAANSGAASSCAWPGCPNGRATFRRVEPRPGVGELLPSCARHALRPDDEALRVWRELVGRKPPAPAHVDEAMKDGLVRELRRRGAWVMRSQLVAWARMQRATELYGAPRFEGTAGTLDAETDALSALDALVREGRAKQRRLPEGDAAYHLVEEDDECETTTTSETTTTTSASPPTKSRSTSPDAAMSGAATSALRPSERKPSAASAPPVADVAPEARGVGSGASATSSGGGSAAAPTADVAPPRATPTTAPPSDTTETTMTMGPAQARVLDYLRENPGSLVSDVADALGIHREHAGTTLRKLQAKGLTRVEDGATRTAPKRWSLATRTPAGTESPKLAGELARLRAEVERLEAEKLAWIVDEEELREWRCRVEAALGFEEDEHALVDRVTDRIAKLKARDIEAGALEAARAEIANLRSVIAAHKPLTRLQQKAGLPGAIVVVPDGSVWDVHDGYGLAANCSADEAMQQVRESMERVAAFRPELTAPTGESQRNTWDAVSDVIVAEADAYAPEGPMLPAEFLRKTLRALVEAAEQRRKPPLLGECCALCGQTGSMPPLTIDGIPYPTALRLVGEVLGLDTASEGAPTLADLARVLRAAVAR